MAARLDALRCANTSVPVAVALIVAAGAYFRLAYLGEAALRADTITFWNICQQPITAADVFRNWLQLMGVSGQFPFPMAFTKWFLSVFQLPVTHFSLRLPSALWGIATVLLAYLAGRAYGTVRHGLVAALLVALDPFHIQVSREAYFYPPLVAGAFLGLWAALWMAGALQGRRAITPFFHAVNAAGFFLLTYSQPTGWPFAFLVALVVLGGTLWRFLKRREMGKDLAALVLAYAVIGVPLLAAHWGLKHLLLNASGATKQASLQAVAVSGETVWSMVFRVGTSFAWGSTLFRAVFTLLVLALGLCSVVRGARENRQALLLPAFLLAGFGLYLLSRGMAGAGFESRYVVVLLPAYLMLLAVGIVEAGDSLAAAVPALGRRRDAVPAVVAAVAAALLVYPAWLATRVTGKPTPYRDIQAWVNTRLAPGTLVLVDRWFEPWNELKVYPSTNVFFTFTVPNEPVETFIKVKWRETAKAFFDRYPDAAYLEIAKSYWGVPTVGPWAWPREYFARHVVISNTAGLRLRELGLANRGDFYAANTNRLVVELFYNTLDDIVKKAQQAGRSLLVVYGPGWSYTKTQDYRDWRVLQGGGAIGVFNLTGTPMETEILVRGVSIGGSKMVKASSGAEHIFPPGEMQEWKVGRALLSPGETVLRFGDPLWPSAQNPLRVEDITVRAVETASMPAPTAATAGGR